MSELKNYIDGHWQQPADLLEHFVCNASDNTELFQQRASSETQVEQALTAAAQCHARGDWAALDAAARAHWLDTVALELETRAEDIARADAISTGALLKFTRIVAKICPAAFRNAAQLLRDGDQLPRLEGPHGDLLYERLPLGPAAIVAPWNAPSGITCHKLASALAAGCPAIVKPSEWAPLSGQYIVEAIEAAGPMPGVVQLVHGAAATGAQLVGDPRVKAVSFTGGLGGGQAVAAACAQQIKPAQLELGGNNPLVVLASANIDYTIEHIVNGMITLNGQWCRALGRLLVHESLHDELLERLLARLALVKPGDSQAEDSDMGPLVHRGHLAHVRESIEKYAALGGVVYQPATLPDLPGNFISPTLIDGLAPELTLDEVFGPVATVHTFSDNQDAVALANQTPFGLAGYVFGEEQESWQVAKGMLSGIVKINAVTMLNLNAAAPRPAWGLSGLGDEGTRETYEFFRGARLIGVGGVMP